MLARAKPGIELSSAAGSFQVDELWNVALWVFVDGVCVG